MKKVLFRADGSGVIGLGHVIRSLALAEMLKDDFYCSFAIHEPSQALYQQISAVCQEVIVLPKTETEEDLLLEPTSYLRPGCLVVLDGYRFTTLYQKEVKAKGHRLICIDDIHAYHFVADMIINHGTMDATSYSRAPGTSMLLGTKYSLLREPFLQSPGARLKVKQQNDVFLCFGGSDSTNLTCIYLHRLLQRSDLDTIHVVVGSAYAHQAVLDSLVQQYSNTVRVYRNIPAKDLAQLIISCKVAIVPGSTIAIECASTGIPMMCGFYVDNQYEIVQMLGDNGLALTLGDFATLEETVFHNSLQKLLSTDKESWVANSKKFFDGKAKMRFVKAFNHLYQLQNIAVRKAVPADVDLYYNWAKDPQVRISAVNEAPIPYEGHCQWFEKKLSATDAFMYVGAWQGKEFGQVRFDNDAGCYTISYSIGCEMRGKGLGCALMDAAIRQLLQDVDVSQPVILEALVKSNNPASLKVFERLQFNLKEHKRINNTEYVLFEKILESNNDPVY